MIKISGLREDMQMSIALKQQINQWLLAINKKPSYSQTKFIPTHHKLIKKH